MSVMEGWRDGWKEGRDVCVCACGRGQGGFRCLSLTQGGSAWKSQALRCAALKICILVMSLNGAQEQDAAPRAAASHPHTHLNTCHLGPSKEPGRGGGWRNVTRQPKATVCQWQLFLCKIFIIGDIFPPMI